MMNERDTEIFLTAQEALKLDLPNLSDDELSQWIKTIRPYVPTQTVGPPYNEVDYFIRAEETEDMPTIRAIKALRRLLDEQERRETSAETIFAEAENFAIAVIKGEGFEVDGRAYYSPDSDTWVPIEKSEADTLSAEFKKRMDEIFDSTKTHDEKWEIVNQLDSEPKHYSKPVLKYGQEDAPIDSKMHVAATLLHLIDYSRDSLTAQIYGAASPPEEAVLHEATINFEIGQLFQKLDFMTHDQELAELGYSDISRRTTAGKKGAQSSSNAKNRRLVLLIEGYELIAEENPGVAELGEDAADTMLPLAMKKAQEIDPGAFSGGQGVTAKAGAEYLSEIRSAKQKGEFMHDLRLRLEKIFPH